MAARSLWVGVLVALGDQQCPADGCSSGETTSLDWSELCEAVDDLRSNPPPYLRRVGQLYEARQRVTKNRALKQRSYKDRPFYGARNCSVGGGGPWRLKVDIGAPEMAPPAYQKDHRLIFVFGKDWPSAPPAIRFASRMHSVYTAEPGEGKLHTAEANGLLLRRLVEAAGGNVTCMWRQTGGCSSSGDREPEKDRLCTEDVPLGSSGFCDCDGDGLKGSAEPGYACDETPGTCGAKCAQLPTGRAPRFKLRPILDAIHAGLGGPLHSADARGWGRAAKDFARDVSVVLKYSEKKIHKRFFGAMGVEDLVEAALLELIEDAMNAVDRKAAREKLLGSGIIEEVDPGFVYSFRVFKPDFSALLMEEITHFYGTKLPARRPNSMNNYGIILNEIGMEQLSFSLQDAVIQPLSAILFPEAGSELESHHAFTIRYRGGEDTHLDVHTDDSDVTFNVNIFENYTGAPLVFCGLNGKPDHRQFRLAYMHKLGYAIMHLGRHRHGAEDITSGERMNLVIWSYSYNLRSSTANMKNHEEEAGPPDKRCVSYTHDRDFGRFRAWPEGKKSMFLGNGWCPPRGKEYPGFVPDVPDGKRPTRRAQRR